MSLIVTFSAATIALSSLILLRKRRKFNLELIAKYLAIGLFLVLMLRSWRYDAIDDTFNLLLVDIKTPIDAPETWLFGEWLTGWMIILRWATFTLTLWLIISTFFKIDTLDWLVAFTFPLLVALNLAFFRENVIAIVGKTAPFWGKDAWRLSGQLALTALLGTLTVFRLKARGARPGKALWWQIPLIWVASSFAVMPPGIIHNFIGKARHQASGFNLAHVIVITLSALIPLGIFWSGRKLSQPARTMLLGFLILAMNFEYFYLPRHGYGGLPLHLCNAAVILLLVSYTTGWRGVFYFNYFANVVGALAAILIPNYTTDATSALALHFYYNHIYAVFIPLLCVGFGLFSRPKLKDMYQAIVVFTGYFLLVAVLTAFLQNFDAGVDYFFTYSNHIAKIFGVERLQQKFALTINVGPFAIKLWWLFHLLLYLGFIFLMFMSWYVYDAFFRIFDSHRALNLRRQEMRMDMLKLRAKLGNKLTEPIRPDGAGKIIIEAFSKRYGNSRRKAVDTFSLEIKAGEVFGFLGHNGAGKSTTIKSLVGIQSITEGDMFINGFSIKSQPMQAKLNLAYVSDNHAVYERLTGREYVNYVADLYGVDPAIRDARLQDYLERFNLGFAIDQEIKSYSHGMKQKLVVIASLIHEPKIWILDEPLTGLDPTSSYQIKKMMRDHADKGNIVFFSSHIIEIVERICDRVAIINAGKLQGVFDVAELRAQGESLEDLYLANLN